MLQVLINIFFDVEMVEDIMMTILIIMMVLMMVEMIRTLIMQTKMMVDQIMELVDEDQVGVLQPHPFSPTKNTKNECKSGCQI